MRRSFPTHFLIDSLLDSIKEIEESEEELPNTIFLIDSLLDSIKEIEESEVDS